MHVAHLLMGGGGGGGMDLGNTHVQPHTVIFAVVAPSTMQYSAIVFFLLLNN